MIASIPSWQMEGVVMEVRGLGTKADKNNVWAYSVKVAATGGTYEFTTREKLVADQFVPGEIVKCGGLFEQFNGAIKLVVTKKFAAVAEAAGANGGAAKGPVAARS